MERPKFIASCSFGKDSLATILLAKEHGVPLDEAVYCEVMFDKGISGEYRSIGTSSTAGPSPHWSGWE